MNEPEFPIPGPIPPPYIPPYVPPTDSRVKIALMLLKTAVELLDDAANQPVPYYTTDNAAQERKDE
jgi:hypothetical protein